MRSGIVPQAACAAMPLRSEPDEAAVAEVEEGAEAVEPLHGDSPVLARSFCLSQIWFVVWSRPIFLARKRSKSLKQTLTR